MKKIIFIIAVILSQSSYSDSRPVASLYYFDPNIPLSRNTDGTFNSHHEFYVLNTTAITQGFAVCYNLVTCNDKDPQWKREVHECTNYVIPSGQGMQGQKDMQLTVNYPFQGKCGIFAQTSIQGFETSKVADEKEFGVW